MGLKVCQLCAVDFTLRHFLLPLIDGMREQGWEVTAVCSGGPGIAELRAEGYDVETVPIARSMNPVLALRSLAMLGCLLRRHRFDVLHAHTPVAALIGRVAARMVKVPLIVYTAHGFYFHEDMPRWKRSLFVALERFGGRCTDLLFSQSSEDATDAVKEGIVSSDHVVAIGNGVNVDRFDPIRVVDRERIRDELGIPRNSCVVGLIGRQVREKGVAEFLVAARLIASRHPNVWFLIVGERLPSDHAEGIEGELAEASAALGQRLVMSGLRSDVPELLAAMDIFCLPSWREGMPRTIIEAMMMAKPVIATNIRGSREEVVPGKTGILVPVRSPQQLADAMEQLVRQPALAVQMGLAGRERALVLYDEKKVVALQLERIALSARQRGLL